ncbi:hypothetical protein [Sinorhizobium meliloti]|uniref:hypothetical protein n=1 Tax=Rhizobium meliloti TaxID=382 RepID=UPI001F3A4E1C|nr:hypothetical protein [Sinorhizobium meliloti]
MSVIAADLKLMRADGMDSDAIVAAVAEMEREMTSGVDRAADKRREWDRERDAETAEFVRWKQVESGGR